MVSNYRRYFIFIICLLSFFSRAYCEQYTLKKEKADTDTLSVRLCLKKGDLLSKTSTTLAYDSALFYYNKAAAISISIDYHKGVYDAYKAISTLTYDNGNFPISLNYLFKVLSLLDDYDIFEKEQDLLQKELIFLYRAIGNSYLNMNDGIDGLNYYEKSLECIAKIDNLSDSLFQYYNFAIHNNISGAYIVKKDYENAKKYSNIALMYANSISNQRYHAILYNNVGIIERELGNLDSAFFYFTKSLDMRISLRDSLGMIQVYNNLARYYDDKNDRAREMAVLSNALALNTPARSLKSKLITVGLLSEAYESIGDYKQALKMSRIQDQLQDSIMSDDRVRQATQLDLQYKYEKQLKDEAIKRHLAESQKEKSILIVVVVSLVLLSLIAVLILLYRNQRIKTHKSNLQRENLRLEKNNLELANKNLSDGIESKNRELALNVMYLSEKNQMLFSIKKKLEDFGKTLTATNNQALEHIIADMSSDTNKNFWNQFEISFQQVNTEFYDKLNGRFPDLTPNEKRLSAFLFLNMSSKEISSITSQSLKSLEIARSRLRKKLDLSRDENLTSFLQQL